MPRRYAGLWLGCLLALRALPGGGVGEVHAAEFTVDVTADSDDSSPGDGLCRASSGLCTLRAAIQEANALAGDDLIKMRSGTYILQDDPAPPAAPNRGDLDVTGNLTIQPLSGSPIIDGKNASRIFEVTRADPDVPVTLTLQGLTLTGGNATSEPTGLPACGLEGGAVCGVGADVRVIDCTVKSHRGDNGGALFVAGGSLTVDRSDVTGNVATSLGGAIAAQGASVVVTNSTVADNKIDAGGSFGGGMAVYDGATLELTNTTFSGNTAVGTGGGLAITGAGAVAVRNCTFSGNTASGEGGGGGIDFRSATSFVLGNATIARNSGGGLKLEGSTGATVRNSLIALNLPNDCNGSADVSANNLLSKSDGCSLTGATLATDPKLASTLETNGTRNESKTLALLEDSPADNQGADCELTDQRGFTRAPACDIGAYERLDDDDEDFVPDGQDNCPEQANADQNDEDRDGIGDVCDCTPKIATTGTPDEDDDGDGVPNRIDCCAATPPLGQDVTCLAGGVGANATGCSVSQACDCTYRMKNGQAYPWGKRKGWKKCVRHTVGKIEGIGKRCKRDISRAIINDPNLASCGKYDGGSGDDDNDGVANASDNCPRAYNPAQENSDEDSEKKLRGDACDDDDDNDNLRDADDKCPTVVSCKNEDADSDGLGNECDQCPWRNDGTGIEPNGCEKGQDGPGAVDPPADCKVVDGGGNGDDDDDGELVNN